MALRQDTYHNWNDLMNIGTWIQIKKGYLLEIQVLGSEARLFKISILLVDSILGLT